MSGIFAFAVGTVRRNTAGAPLDFYFPAPVINPEPDLAAQIEGSFSSGAHEVGPAELARFAKAVGDSAMARLLSSLAETDRAMTAVRLDADEPIDSSATAIWTAYSLIFPTSLGPTAGPSIRKNWRPHSCRQGSLAGTSRFWPWTSSRE
jgi:hypothetical protein